MQFQSEKNRVLEYYKTIDCLEDEALSDALSNYTCDNWIWRGFYPFNEHIGAANVANQFWLPFKNAMTSMQRRQDIFFAGANEIDGFQSTWVVSMGHLVGLFDRPFLGIPPTGKMAFFRYCEFNKIEQNRITETAFYFDLPHFMIQAGLHPFKKQRAAQLVQPGPITHKGLCFEPSAPEEGKKTLAVINKMITDLGQWQSGLSLEDELRRTWHEDMIWWGPTGIGATYTIERYAKQHSGPFREAFDNRSKTTHIARLAEDHFGGFFGWPNFTANLKGEFLGIEPSEKRAEFRVIDIYRRAGNKLAENWVFIDFPHWFKQNGVELLP